MADIRIVPALGAINVTGSADFRGDSASTVLYVSGSGNVGVGTSNPISKLHIAGAVKATATTGHVLGTSTDTGRALSILNSGLAHGESYSIALGYGNSNNNQAEITYYLAATGSANNRLGLGLYNSPDTLNITGNGRVGIGTTAPGAPLHIVAGGTSQIRLQHSAYNYWDITSAYNNTNADLYFIMNGSEKFRIDANGNVGIGSTSPGYKLDVSGTGRFLGSGTTTAAIFNNSATSGTSEYYAEFTSGATALARMFRGNGAAGVVDNGLNIDNYSGFQIRANQLGGSGGTINLLGGNVGIGTASPSTHLTIYSTTNETGLAIHSSGSRNYRMFVNPAWAPGSLQIYDATADVSVIHISPTSNVGIGVGATSPTKPLHVVGGVRFSSYGAGSITGTAAKTLAVDSSGNVIEVNNASLDGTGTANRVAYWTDSDTLAADNDFFFDGTSVGIGTTSPVLPLQVSGRAQFGDTVTMASFTSAPVSIRTTTTESITLTHTAVQSYSMGVTSGGTFALRDIDAQVDRINITQGGNVGIGTTSPTSGIKLDVRGYIASNVNSDGVEGGFYLGNSGHGIRRPGGASNDVYVFTTSGTLYLGAGGSSSQQVTILTGGNVGIGNTNPAQKLHVTGVGRFDNNIQIYGDWNTTYPVVQLLDSKSGGATWNIENGRNSNNLEFYSSGVAGTVFSVLHSNGNVGIGSTVPGYKLDVAGNARINSTIYFGTNAASYIGYDGANAYYRANGIHYFEGNGFYKGAWDANGNLGVGTTTPGYTLDVNGTIAVPSFIRLTNGGPTVTYLSEAYGINLNGDATHPVQVANASLLVGLSGAGSNYGTGNLYVAGNSFLSGDLSVTGKITAREFHTSFVSASIIYQSGSTQFGNSGDDTHAFIGRVTVSGSTASAPSGQLNVYAGDQSWSEGVVVNPNSGGTGAIFFRATKDTSTSTWFVGHNGSEGFSIIKESLTGSTGYRTDLVQQLRNTGQAVFGFGVTAPSFTGSLQGNITGTAASETLDTVTGRGATTSNLITINSSDVGLKVQENGTSTAWRGRLGSFNSSADKSSFLGNYTGRPGVFGHNNALSAWAELYVNTLGIYGQGNLYLSWYTYVKGDGSDTNYAIWHAGNDGAGSGLDADTLDGNHASAFLTAEADTLATVTGRGASTSTASTFSGGLTTNVLYLSAPTGDPSPLITSRVVPAGQGAASEVTELILFHSNDPNNGAGPDYITLRSPAIRLQTYNNAAVDDIDDDLGSNDRLRIEADGTIKLSSLTSNGFVKTSAGDGTLSIDTSTYLTAEADTLATVTGRGATTAVPLTFSYPGPALALSGTGSYMTFKDNDNTWTGTVGFNGNTGVLSFPGRNVQITAGYNGTIELSDGASGYNSGKVYIPYGNLILDNGNIGVNTSSPSNRVQVVGGVTATSFTGSLQGNITGTAASETLQTVTTRGSTTDTDISIGGSGGDRGLGIYHGSGAGHYGKIRFYQDSTNINTIHSFPAAWQGGTIFNASTHAINIAGSAGTTFGGWNDPDAVIVSGGQSYFKGSVGIGTTSPGAKLDVTGNIRTSTYYNFNGNPSVPTNTTAAIFDQAGVGPTISGLNITFRTDSTTPAEIMRVSSGGNVGIGITNPNAKFVSSKDVTSNDFNNLGAVQLKLIGNTYTNKQLLLGFETDNNYGFVQTLNDGTSWSSYNLTIQPKGGNVGIGTTVGSQKVVIAGDNGQPATSSTTQYGLLRLHAANGITGYGEALDMGMHVGVSGPASYAWLQATNTSNLALNYALALNPNGGNVNVRTTTSTRRFNVGGSYYLEGAAANYSSYTSDGLFNANALPMFIGSAGYSGTYGRFSSAGGLVLGYQDNASGLYSPAYAFEVKSTDGAGNTNRVVKAILIKNVDTDAEPFVIYNNGALTTTNTVTANSWFVSETNKTVSGGGPYDWIYLGAADGNASRASAVQIGDVSGAKYAIMGGSYDLTFAKHDADANAWATAMTINGADANDGAPTVTITNGLTVGGTITGNITGTAGSETLATVTGRGASTSTQTTFTGNVVLEKSSGNNILNITSAGGGTPVIYMTGPSRGWGQFVDGTNLWFKDETGNVVTMVLRAGGNVGIGTTNPGTLLQVSPGNSYTADPTIQVVSSYADGYDAIVSLNNTHTGGRNWMLRSTNNSQGDFSGGKLVFQDRTAGSSTSVMTLVTGGNVGIGVTNPTQALHVAANVTTNTGITVQNLNGSYSSQYRFLNSSGTEVAAITYIGGTTSNVYHYTSVGGNLLNLVGANVGVGTTAPGAKLDVSGDIFLSETGRLQGRAYPYDTTVGSGADASTAIIEAGSTNGYRSRIALAGGNATDPNTIKMLTTSEERLRITSGGKVGIGTTNPGGLLGLGTQSTVQSTSGITLGVNDSSLEFVHATFSNGFGSKIYSADSGGGVTSLRIAGRGNSTSWSDLVTVLVTDNSTTRGNVGIATTAPGEKLDVVGNIALSGIFKGTSTGENKNFASYDWHWLGRRYANYVSDVRLKLYEYFYSTTATVQEAFVNCYDMNSVNYMGENIWGDVHQYHAIFTTHIYVKRQFSVTNVLLNGDDPYALWVDGAYVAGADGCCTGTTYSYTFTQGWHRLDLIYSEGGGGHFVQLGWNPKDYTDYIAAMTPFGPVNLFDTGDVTMRNDRVGIGTTNPGYRLEVDGTAAFGTTTRTEIGNAASDPTGAGISYGMFHHSGVGLGLASGASSTNQGISFWNHNGSSFFRSMIIAGTNGNVGIGSTVPAYKLDVTGTIRATGDVIAYSDRRVKENIVTLENSLDLVTKLRGVEYNKIGEEDKKIGVIAQEVLEVLPQVVQQDQDGNYSVAYGNMAGLFIEAIKQQQTHIETLEDRISVLEQLLRQKL